MVEKNNEKEEYGYEDVIGKVLINVDNTENQREANLISKKGNLSLEQCKEECNKDQECTWIQHYNKKENECYLFKFAQTQTKKYIQWQKSDYELKNYTINLNEKFPHVNKQESSSAECHEECIKSSNCMFSIFENETSNTNKCTLYYYEEQSGATLSYVLDPIKKMEINTKQINEIKFNNTIPRNEMDDGYSDTENQNNINIFTLYGLTIIILILIAVILCICKRRSENEKLLMYTLSNVTANSQSRSRSKSSPSENMSYMNNNNLNSSYFQNVNASSVTINPETLENIKLMKNYNGGTNFKKSSRRSTCSKAPSIHSVSTLCTNTSNNNMNNNNNTIDGSDKGHHNLSLITKKSQYNYSIKTFSAKDPTGLSHNIKSLFANSYTVNGFDTNSYNDNCSVYNSLTSSPNIEPSHDNNLNKDIINSNNHRKQSSSISINVPKGSSSSSTINISPRNSINGTIVSVTTQQQPKIVKLKKSLHTKQLPVTPTGFCTEPVSPINSTDDYIHIDNDEVDSEGIPNGQDNLLFNTDNTVTNIATISVTKVK